MSHASRVKEAKVRIEAAGQSLAHNVIVHPKGLGKAPRSRSREMAALVGEGLFPEAPQSVVRGSGGRTRTSLWCRSPAQQ
ncbi:hypothetical protein ACVILK_006822 [Bradyrhizobium embrapense]